MSNAWHSAVGAVSSATAMNGDGSANMSIRAGMSNGYRMRLVLIAALFTGFGCWSLYDGLVAYPRKQEMGLTWVKLREAGAPKEEWLRIAQEKGWPTEEPTQISDMSIRTQFIMASITLPLGLIFLYGLVRSLGRYVELDGDTLKAGGRRSVSLSDVQRVDSDRWKTKGIAVVHYPQGRILLDDWKFDREATAQIYNAVVTAVAARAGAQIGLSETATENNHA
jgi:hypothetical protein